MAGLRWMAVMLVFFPSVGSSAAVDQNKLAKLIQAVKNKYPIYGMFSLALSIQSEDPKNLEQLFADNPEEDVNEQLLKGAVYKGCRLAVAKVKAPEHAEFRVLQNLNLVSKDNDLLVIYSHASSCPGTCTNKGNTYNIIKLIKKVIANGRWSRHVFVFEKVFKPKGTIRIEECKLITALKELGTSGIHLANIFRCYKLNNSNFQCTSCSRGGNVAKECIDYGP